VNEATWIALGIALIVVVMYVLWFKKKKRESDELDKKIDYSKIRKIEDDD